MSQKWVVHYIWTSVFELVTCMEFRLEALLPFCLSSDSRRQRKTDDEKQLSRVSITHSLTKESKFEANESELNFLPPSFSSSYRWKCFLENIPFTFSLLFTFCMKQQYTHTRVCESARELEEISHQNCEAFTTSADDCRLLTCGGDETWNTHICISTQKALPHTPKIYLTPIQSNDQSDL